MVVCDGIWRDPYTGKKTLLGIFSALGGESFPLRHPVLSVYVSLTDGRGRMPIRLELVDAEEQLAPVFSDTQEIEFTDPRAVSEICFEVRGLEFPGPGEYRLRLFANEEFVIERQIVVLGASDEGPGHE
jgi:hypothetical protein